MFLIYIVLGIGRATSSNSTELRGDLWAEFGVKRASLKLGGDLQLEALPFAFRPGKDEARDQSVVPSLSNNLCKRIPYTP